jgi:serine/threonine protein kinase
LKPENLLIGKDSNIKLVDFGFACKINGNNNSRIKINSNVAVGSPG